MLTPKRNGHDGDFFRAVLRRHDDSTKAWGSKPLSHILRQQRESRKLSLPEAARFTGIPMSYLHLLERAGDERLGAAPLSLIASLRRYAIFLNLNPDITVAQFIAELEQVPPLEAAGRGAPHTQLLTPLPRPRSRVLPRTLFFLLACGLLAGVGSYSVLRWEQRPNADKSAALPPPSAPAPAPQSGAPPPASSLAPSASPADAGQSQLAAPSPAALLPVTIAAQAEPTAAAPQGQSPGDRSDPQSLQSSERKAGEGFQSPSLSHQRPLTPFSGATVSNAEVTGESAEAVSGSAKEQFQDLGEKLERTAKGTALPKVDEERPKGGQTVVPERDNRQAETTRRRRGTKSNRPPHIVAASPPAHVLEITAGEVQRFVVQAFDPEKDTRLAYTWFLDGQEVARGPTWEFQAPTPPPTEPGHQVKVEVSDSRGGKARASWNFVVTRPSPVPRIVEAQPHDRKVVIEAGEALEFSVAAEIAGGAQEASQGLRYQWQVDDTPPQTTQTPSFRFVDTTPAPHRVMVLAISPEGFKSTPKGWLVEVRPADVPPLPPVATPQELPFASLNVHTYSVDGALPSQSQKETNTPLPQAAPGAESQDSGPVSQPVAAPIKNDQASSINLH
jgi:cytoskeletal protein RodZ